MPDGRAAAARRNGKLGGRPRLFANGTRAVTAKIPEDDARLLELLAVKADTTVSKLVARACWQLLSTEGLSPTWGVPDAERPAVGSPVQDRAAASADDGTDHPRGPSELLHPAMDRAVPRVPGWGACHG